MIKELSKKYFANHPLKEFSAARFEYSLYTMKGIEELVNDRFKPDAKDLQDETVIDSAVKPGELLQCMRKGLSGKNRQKLRNKILENEAEMMLLIQRRAVTNLQDEFQIKYRSFFSSLQRKML